MTTHKPRPATVGDHRPAPRDHAAAKTGRRRPLAVISPRFASLAGPGHLGAIHALGALLPELDQAAATDTDTNTTEATCAPAGAAVPNRSKTPRGATRSGTLPPRRPRAA